MVFIGITNSHRYILNLEGFCYYKSGQLLQIGSDLLQIDEAITNQGNYYTLVHNTPEKVLSCEFCKVFKNTYFIELTAPGIIFMFH